MTTIFQGDIAYVKMTKEQAEKLLSGKNANGQTLKEKFVVAHGESGNHHTIVKEKDTDTIEMTDMGNGMFIFDIKGQAVIDHEKHKPAKTLTSGLWFVSRKTEYDPIQERLVQD